DLARRVRLLLPMRGLLVDVSRRRPVLHAEHDLAGAREKHAPEPGAAPEYAGRMAHPRRPGRILGEIQHHRPDSVGVRHGSDLLAGRAQRQLLSTDPTMGRLTGIHADSRHWILR